MKIAVIGAAGRQGSLLVKEAQSRGIEVTGFVKPGKCSGANRTVEKDLFDLTYGDLQEYDVIIDAFGVWKDEEQYLHKKSLEHLANLLSGKPNRLLIVGGAGSLYVDPEHQVQLMDTPEFPEAFQAVAAGTGEAFEMIKEKNDVNWTFLSPPADFRADGPLTGTYQEGKDELLVDSRGESQISYADYAIAMIDEAQRGKHIQERFTICAK